MKITVDENRDLLLTEIYNPIRLKSDGGEELTICIRDGGFEIGSRNLTISKLFENYTAHNGSILLVLD